MSGQRQLFGTDGIRGVAGEYPLDERTVFAIGKALGHRLSAAKDRRAVVGQDTRESSQWIANTIAGGLASAGIQVESAGVVTTPGIAFLARSNGFAAGIVISASHNPWMDNGIKVFSADGYKLPDEVEHAIEKEIFALLGRKSKEEATHNSKFSALPGDAHLRQSYVQWLVNNTTSKNPLNGLRALIDCANGAATSVAHDVFNASGVDAKFTHCAPDGRNINTGCRALHPETVGRSVASNPGRYDLGITFDGDADRALFSDASGRVVNGDAVLLLAARDMQARKALPGNTVVATTMSNMGLEIALGRSGIKMLRAPVGDKYVLEEMKKTGATLGGEQSGHIIFRDGDSTTGDGLLTALRVMEIMARSGKPLADLVHDLRVFPQAIRNVRVREKKPLNDLPAVARAIAAAENELDGNGRVVVRYSGTEALARVMVEAESEEKMKRITDEIADRIEETLGV